MKAVKKNRLNSVLAIVLLCTMGLKMGVSLLSHFTACNDSYSIEKSAEEGKDTKEENFSKGEKKLLFEGRFIFDHHHNTSISHAKPVCRYKLQEVTDPPQSVATPPPNRA